MDLGLKDKVVAVMASSKGLGKATAMEFAKEGAIVFISSRSEEKLQQAFSLQDRKSTRLNSSHPSRTRMPSSA